MRRWYVRRVEKLVKEIRPHALTELTASEIADHIQRLSAVPRWPIGSFGRRWTHCNCCWLTWLNALRVKGLTGTGGRRAVEDSIALKAG